MQIIRDIILIALTSITNAVAQLLLKYGMNKIVQDSSLASTIIFILKNRYIWMGLIMYGISFVIYLCILAKLEVSLSYPIIMGVTFTLLSIFSSILINELLSVNKIIGSLLILIGIIVISL